MPDAQTNPQLSLGQGFRTQFRGLHPQCPAGQCPGPGPGPQGQVLASSNAGPGPQGPGATTPAATGRRRLVGRPGPGPDRGQALSPLSPAGHPVRRAPAPVGDASRLRPGRRQFRPGHPHEPDRGARALSGALPRTGPAVQRPGLLELVRYPLRAGLWRGAAHHGCCRAGLPAVPGGPRPRRHRGACRQAPAWRRCWSPGIRGGSRR